MVAVTYRYPQAVLALFGRMLIDDREYHTRITEEATAVGEILQSTITLTFACQEADLAPLRRPEGHTSTVLLVPMLKATIGTLLDNVNPADADGGSIPLLSQRDTRGLLAFVLEGLFDSTFGPDDPDRESILFELRRLVCKVGRIPDATWDTLFDSAVRGRAATPPLEELRRFCKFFALNYVLVAEIPVPLGNEFVLRYTRMMPVYGRADHRKPRLRVRLGLAPYSFRIPMNLAFSAASYHFWMYTGPNMYVKLHYLQQHLGDASPVGEFRTFRQDDLQELGGGAYLRVRHRQALPHAHLYTRGLHKATPQQLLMVVNFAEIPPGTLGVATVLAFISTLTMLLLAAVIPDSASANGDILALLLAVPGFVATFIGYSMDRIQRSSLTTLAGLLGVGAVSFGASLLYALTATPSWMVVQVSLFGADAELNLVVVGLVVMGLTNLLNLVWRLGNEMRYYLALLTTKNTISRMFS